MGRSRFGASSRYIYGTFAVQRSLALGKGWEFMGKGVLQRSSSNLIANEQLAIGGSGSIRGYDENVYAAENGFVLNTELLAPVWTRKLSLGKTDVPFQGRVLAFLDMGDVNYRISYPSDIRLAPLASTGIGFRGSLRDNLTVNFDYGWQLTHQARQPTMAVRPPLSSRGHVKVVLAF
jgi:hemolysin activation/secretion protein